MLVCWPLALAPVAALAQEREPLHIEITEGVIEPLPFAIPAFIAETAAAPDRWPAEITQRDRRTT